MSWRNIFRSRQSSASLAKSRLQIVVTRERNSTPDYLPQLKQELMRVIAKYENIDLDQVSLQFDRREDCGILELEIILPEDDEAPELIGRRSAACA